MILSVMMSASNDLLAITPAAALQAAYKLILEQCSTTVMLTDICTLVKCVTSIAVRSIAEHNSMAYAEGSGGTVTQHLL